MFSLIRRLRLANSGPVIVPVPCTGGFRRCISTGDGVKNSEHLSKSGDRIGGLPTDVVLEQKMKRTTRTLSTLQNHSVPIAARLTVSKDESRDFMAVFPDLVRNLTQNLRKYKCDEIVHWFAKALQYNVPCGKKNRALVTVLAYKHLVSDEQLTPENIKLAHYLGWCVEMLQSFYLITDDIVDNSTTRRGQACWHTLNDVGMIAVTDAALIESSIYEILRQHFRHLDCYADILELFHETTFITNAGQLMDVLNEKKTVGEYTMENYKAVVANKTSQYTFYLPFALAMHLAGIRDAEAFRQSKTILFEMGHFYQVQDDFLDCFGNPDITGKIGTDIEDKKCSWLAVVCMQRANAEQKALMTECYGQSDPVKVERVKQLYKELGLPNTYATYEEETYNMIKLHIQQTSRGVPHKIFLDILNKIYQRDS